MIIAERGGSVTTYGLKVYSGRSTCLVMGDVALGVAIVVPGGFMIRAKLRTVAATF